jgi:hypothetical protein
MVDDALGIAGGAGGVVERDGVPLVVGHPPGELRVARGDELFVAGLAQALALDRELEVVVVDDERPRLGPRQRLLDGAGKLLVGDQHLRFGMVEGKGDGRRIEAGVERVEHRAGHRHAVVALDHRRGVGEHRRDRVALADAAGGKRRGEPAGAGVELGIAVAQGSVNDRRVVRMDGCGTLQEGQRRERLIIGRVPVEIEFVCVRHCAITLG